MLVYLMRREVELKVAAKERPRCVCARIHPPPKRPGRTVLCFVEVEATIESNALTNGLGSASSPLYTEISKKILSRNCTED